VSQDRPNRTLGFSTRAIHHAYDAREHQGAVAPPVYFTSTYTYGTVEETEAAAAQGGLLYAREHNPTTELLEARLANLESAEAGVVVATGMAAIGTLLLSILSQGDEIVVHKTLYSNTRSLMKGGIPRFGIKVVPVDVGNRLELARALTSKTRIVYFETPVNPTGEVLDIAAIAEVARQVGALVVVDSTWASPAVQRPLEFGADLVVHSLTKYINGHGDVLGGAVVGRRELVGQIHEHGVRYLTGATISPLAAALVMRGLKTLSLRMERHAATALKVAEFLEAHPAVAWVSYPYLKSGPSYAIARRQMTNGSGMLAFGLKQGFEGARSLLGHLELVTCAVSLGDAETLISHPATLTRARKKIRPEATLAPGGGEDLIRLSVGLEDDADLIHDLQRALSRVEAGH
jgi:methionine-gamma-lyase